MGSKEYWPSHTQMCEPSACSFDPSSEHTEQRSLINHKNTQRDVKKPHVVAWLYSSIKTEVKYGINPHNATHRLPRIA